MLADRAFYNLDCLRGAIEHLSDESVDLIVTDPPYGIDGDRLHRHYNRDEPFVIDGYVEVDRGVYNAFSRAWIAQAYRVLRPGGQIYVISAYTNLYDVLDALRSTDLREINHLIWKYNFGVYTSTKFVSSHYHILYYAKPGGRRTFRFIGFEISEKTFLSRAPRSARSLWDRCWNRSRVRMSCAIAERRGATTRRSACTTVITPCTRPERRTARSCAC